MPTCSNCGGRLKRVPRAFLERLSYMAVFECPRCSREEYVPRRWRYHLGPECRCPKCGTYRVSKLRERDKIDPLHTGLLHLLERLMGGALHYCCFCRLQFYDRRKLAPRGAAAAAPAAVTSPQDTAKSGV